MQTTLELYGHVTPKMQLNAAVRFAGLVDGTGGRRLAGQADSTGIADQSVRAGAGVGA